MCIAILPAISPRNYKISISTNNNRVSVRLTIIIKVIEFFKYYGLDIYLF